MKTILCFLFFIGLFSNTIQSQTNWNEKYDAQSVRVAKHENQPPGSETRLEEYLYWMGVHAKDRDDIAVIIEELHPLAIEDPEGDYAQWEVLFIDLKKRAEWSGYSTLRSGSERLLNVEDKSGNYCGWFVSIWKAINNGRPLYLKAIETQFDESIPRAKVECLLINAINNIEDDAGGMGLYLGRERYHGYIDDEGNSRFWEGDYAEYCERRNRFYVHAEGEPNRPVSWAFKNIDTIREECDWWNFPDLRQDATDLMNQYYEDALCKQPPHKQNHGHHYFLELAKQYELDESIAFNEGFYGTVYGKVEIMDGGTKSPAADAKVTIRDHDQTWTVMTDDNGHYESPNTILHKDCSPFFIKAEHKGDWIDDTFEGILSKPNTSTRLEKNLLIQRNREYVWKGSISLLNSDQLDCTIEKTNGNNTTINKKHNRIQNINIDIKVKGQELLEGGLSMLTEENMAASGYVEVNLKNEYEKNSVSTDRYLHEYSKESGQDIFSVVAKDIIIQIFKEQKMDQEEMARKLQEIAEKGLEDPEAMEKNMNDLQASMSGQNEKQVPVNVILRLNKISLCNIHLYKYRETGKSGHQPVIEEDESDTELPVPSMLSWAIKGTYFKDDNGEDRIIATYEESKPNESGDKDCIHEGSVSNSFSFELVRKRIK